VEGQLIMNMEIENEYENGNEKKDVDLSSWE
jgi:hypothetical protein